MTVFLLILYFNELDRRIFFFFVRYNFTVTLCLHPEYREVWLPGER
jgi:hypothetical protein